MNGHAPDQELPALTDDQIATLDSICKTASRIKAPPSTAIFNAYETELQDRGLDSSRDNEIFRWILRVSESARRWYRPGRATDFVPYLRDLLEAHGITVVDTEGEVDGEIYIEGVTRSLEEPESIHKEKFQQPKRRVSFDDARLDETFLSERSRLAEASSAAKRHEPSRRPPGRAGAISSPQLARSASLESTHYQEGSRQPAPKHYQEASPSSEYTSEQEEQRHHTLLFDLSHTQLDINADTFYHNASIKLRRKYFALWREQALELRSLRSEWQAAAVDTYSRNLLRDCIQVWHGDYLQRRMEQDHLAQLDEKLVLFQGRSHRWLLAKSLDHWHRKTVRDRHDTNIARHHLLRYNYFRKWRTITVENATKARIILSRKYLRLWQDRVERNASMLAQAVEHREQMLKSKCLLKWRWSHQERSATEHDKTRLQLWAFQHWRVRADRCRLQDAQANDLRTRKLTGCALATLSFLCAQRVQTAASAGIQYDRKLAAKCMFELQIQANLTPGKTKLSLKIALRLKQKAFRAWHMHFSLSRQAENVDRNRVLQSAWTAWNDSLRCRALAQRLDENVLREYLKAWQLQTLLRRFERSKDYRLIRRSLITWNDRRVLRDAALAQASVRFAEGQIRRRQSFAMRKLNMAIRNREDAERAALEFSNSRTLPDVLAVWKQRTEHARQLAKWAADARFYCLSNSTLKLWRERTVEHQHQRRREAYAQVRARIKIRIVGTALGHLRSNLAETISMKAEAEHRALSRLFQVGMEAFNVWRQKTAALADLDIRATATDHQKLLGSALSALVVHHTDISAMEEQAVVFRQETDLSILSNALRKAQWATFTAARRSESADALQARNNDLHLKQMLRHWASQAGKRMLAKQNDEREPDSPSLRPASRAAVRSVERSQTLPSSPPVPIATPAYMRTPSRSRRTARFRALPTPAHVTPMAFDPAYYVTTPAPATNTEPTQAAVESSDVFEALTPQITPFARKLRAGGVTSMPPSALRGSILGRSMTGTGGGGTAKSVRFAGTSRFGSGGARRIGTTDG